MIAPAPESALGESLSEQVLVALRRIMRAIDLHSRALAHRCGLTGPQLIVLKKLKDQSAVVTTIGQLARAVHLSQATVTGILTRLETRGLVTRTRCATDRRQVIVALTDTAIDMLDQAPPLLQDRFLAAFGKTKDWEQHQILASLQRVVDMMEVGDLEATPMLETGLIDAGVSTDRHWAAQGDATDTVLPAAADQD